MGSFRRRGGRGNLWTGLLPVALLWVAGGCGGSSGDGGPLAEAPRDGDEGTPGVAVTPTAPQDSSGLPQRPIPAAASPWNLVVGGPQDDVGTGVATAPSGDVAVVVYSTPRQDGEREPVEGEKLALTLARYAADGTPRWSREWGRNRFSDTRVAASDAATFLSGNAFLYSADFGLGEAQDGFLVKFDAEGSPVWQHRVGQKVYAIAADAQGGVLAAGEEWEGEFIEDPVLTRYAADGSVLWTRRFHGANMDTALHAAALAPSGQSILAGQLVDALEVDGQTFGAPGVRGFVVLAFDASGRLLWGKELPGVKGRITSVTAAADGTLVAAGDFIGLLVWGEASLGSSGAFVLTAGADGSARWVRQPVCGPVTELGASVAVEDSGGVAVTCGSVLTRYAASGTWLGEQTLEAQPCASGVCSLTTAGVATVPGRGLAVTGWQRDGAGDTWNQDAFLRLVVP
ncbi:hypothetical protein [Myxococcus xanthus]|uniref:hypothetical protein n=1 Tax=Myxococcus xanthus TaxID=34 RepID=UPI0011294465|nr:hypothetical protein [Myxococcus xanthus]QDF08038.1 hypothetical protein BHS04_33250 [Myxococcus xanthus]